MRKVVFYFLFITFFINACVGVELYDAEAQIVLSFVSKVDSPVGADKVKCVFYNKDTGKVFQVDASTKQVNYIKVPFGTYDAVFYSFSKNYLVKDNLSYDQIKIVRNDLSVENDYIFASNFENVFFSALKSNQLKLSLDEQVHIFYIDFNFFPDSQYIYSAKSYISGAASEIFISTLQNSSIPYNQYFDVELSKNKLVGTAKVFGALKSSSSLNINLEILTKDNKVIKVSQDISNQILRLNSYITSSKTPELRIKANVVKTQLETSIENCQVEVKEKK